MENYDPYPYRYPPPPPANSDPGPPPPPYAYPFNSPPPFPSQPYPPPYQSHSGPLDPPHTYHSGPVYPSQPVYPYVPISAPSSVYPNSNYSPPYGYISPQPSLQHHGSFNYDSPPSTQHDQQYYHSGPLPSSAYPPSKTFSRISSTPDYHRQDSSDSLTGGSSSSSLYPIDNLLASVRLSDQELSSSETPSASNSTHGYQGQNSGFSQTASVYNYGNHSFSGHFGSYSPHAVPSPVSLSDGSQHGQNLQMVPYQPSKASLKVLLLHGSLDICIFEANNLPNMDKFSKTLKDVFGKMPSVGNKIEGRIPGQHSMTSDPYVSIVVSKAVVGRTYVISNSENPVWNQHFLVPVAHYAAEVCFVVKDSDVVGSQFIGTVAIPAEQLYSGSKVEGYFPILGTNGKPCNRGAVLRICIQYMPIEQQTMYDNGVGAGPDYYGVSGTYFPLRRGGKVTLYQDAHVLDGSLPDLKLDGGMQFEHRGCWHDICDAIRQARRLIYITGWSLYHKVRLVRDSGYVSVDSLGDLLRIKSQEGVRVLLLVWDDPTSRKFWLLQTVRHISSLHLHLSVLNF